MIKRVFLACALLCVLLASRAIAIDKPACAVLTIEAKGGLSQEEASLLTDRLAAELDWIGHYRLVNRSRMKEVLQSQEFSRADNCSASDCAVEAGQLLGVEFIVFGSVGRFGKVHTVNAYLIDVQTTAVLNSVVIDHEGAVEKLLTQVMKQVAGQLSRTVDGARHGYVKAPAAAKKKPSALTRDERKKQAPPARTTRESVPESKPSPQFAIALSRTGGSPRCRAAVRPAKNKYSAGERVTFAANPARGYSFQAWGGDVSGTRSFQTVVVRSDLDVTAHFSKRPPRPRTWFVSLRGGVSAASGIVGVEVQWHRVALAAGYAPASPVVAGLKYYHHARKNAWHVGVVGGIKKATSYQADGTVVGALAGYRWIWESGLDASVGLGAGVFSGSSVGADLALLPEATVGYSF